MKWIGISGSWRNINIKLESDVRKIVKGIIKKGDGIISGGALGVDYFATEEALKLNPSADQIRIYLPTTLKMYFRHYKKRAKEGVITFKQADMLISQLGNLKRINKSSLIENKLSKKINKKTYYNRNLKVINASNELVAFQVNKSEGTQDAINKAKQKGIPIKIFEYLIF